MRLKGCRREISIIHKRDMGEKILASREVELVNLSAWLPSEPGKSEKYESGILQACFDLWWKSFRDLWVSGFGRCLPVERGLLPFRHRPWMGHLDEKSI